MSASVTLTITSGSLKGQKFVFREPTTCIIGRGHNCNPKLPDDKVHRTISRYHCLLEINPPHIRVRDFGSLNGTYVNGQKIGQRQFNQTPSEGDHMSFPEYELLEGDVIQLGNTVFRVGIQVDFSEASELLDLLPPPLNMHGSKQSNTLRLRRGGEEETSQE
ncbi:MAG: FHA domain-containing protein [Xenococcaceae cyanobacterium]